VTDGNGYILPSHCSVESCIVTSTPDSRCKNVHDLTAVTDDNDITRFIVQGVFFSKNIILRTTTGMGTYHSSYWASLKKKKLSRIAVPYAAT
jgi:hypothetical protein